MLLLSWNTVKTRVFQNMGAQERNKRKENATHRNLVKTRTEIPE